MELQKHKKDKMQVVKKVLILIAVVNIFQSCFSQGKLDGKYMRKDAALIAQDIGSSYLFNEDNKFSQTNFLHLESQEVFNGSYKLIKDTLFLFYKPKLRKELGYEFIEKKKLKEKNSTNYLLSKIKIINKEIRKSDVEMLIYDNQGKLLMGFTSDENGEYPYLSLYDTKIEYFMFSSLVYQEVKIPATELFGYSSEVHVLLEKTLINRSQRNDTIKYLIKSFNKRKIELKNIKTKEKVILYKQ